MASRMFMRDDKKKEPYEPVKMETVTDPEEAKKLKEEAGIKDDKKKVTLDDIYKALTDTRDETIESYKRLNVKINEVGGDTQILAKKISRLEKKVEDLEGRAGSPVARSGITPSVSLLGDCPTKDYTGDCLVYYPKDNDGTRWPIKNRFIAEYYGADMIVPFKLENGIGKRPLTVKEASEAGC